MGFTKGEGGRSKGTPNKTSSAIREVYEGIITDNSDRIQYALNALYDRQPAKFLDVMVKLSEFVIPKMRSVEGDINMSGDGVISKITVEVQHKDKEPNEGA